MVAILESYRLRCNACGKPKKVSRLHVHGNLGEIERTWVCPECERSRHADPGAGPAASEDETAA